MLPGIHPTPAATAHYLLQLEILILSSCPARCFQTISGAPSTSHSRVRLAVVAARSPCAGPESASQFLPPNPPAQCQSRASAAASCWPCSACECVYMCLFCKQSKTSGESEGSWPGRSLGSGSPVEGGNVLWRQGGGWRPNPFQSLACPWDCSFLSGLPRSLGSQSCTGILRSKPHDS